MAASLLRGQMDYLLFFSGLSLIVLAAVCASLRRNEREILPWSCLGLFGAILGMAEWLALLAFVFGEGLLVRAVVISATTLSYVFLVEFGRRGMARLARRVPGWWLQPVLLSAAVAGGAVFGWAGFDAAARYTLGFFGGVLASLALGAAARRQIGQAKTSLAVAGVAMGAYAVLTGMAAPAAPFFPASLLNRARFLACTGLPIPLVHGILGLVMAAFLARYASQSYVGQPGLRRLADRFHTLDWTTFLALAFVLAGGWIATQYGGLYARDTLRGQGRMLADSLKGAVSALLRQTDRAVLAMAGAPSVSSALATGRRKDLERVQTILDQHQKSLEFSVCCLLDRTGKAVASSRRNDPDSFVGLSDAFRPYSQQAAAGCATRGFALGATSRAPGYYAGEAVTDPRTKRVVGAAVILRGMDGLATVFRQYGHAFLVDPTGIVLLSGRPDLGKTSLWPLKAEARRQILASGQFGSGPFRPLLAREPRDGEEMVLRGERFVVSRQAIDPDCWSVVIFQPAQAIGTYRMAGIGATLGLCTLALFFFTGVQRSLSATEKIALAERRFRDALEHAPVGVLIVDKETGRILLANPCFARWIGRDRRELLAMTWRDLREGGPGQSPECRYRHRQGDWLDAEETTVGLPFDGKDALLVFARDRTERKVRENTLRESPART